MDGTEGKAYKTLLTENHNAYVVKGRVTGTHATSAAEVGTVAFDIEYADNFDGVYTIDEKLNPGSTTSITAYVGNTNAEDLLFTYAEALIALDENDEATILTIVPYGRNEIVELAADDYETATYNGSAPLNLQVIEFVKSATSTKTDKYEIDAAAKMYVNGKKVADGGATPADPIVAADIAAYVSGNGIGTVTLINSPAAGSTSLDRDFDVVMVTLPKWAIIDEVIVSGDIIKVIFDDFEDNTVGAYVNIDTTDEDVTYSFYKNGEEIAVEDIKSGDVALLTYDVVGGNANASNYITFDLADTVVEGMVTGASSDGKYTVNGEQYELFAGSLTVGYEYSLIIDAAGRVVKFEELASTKNYGIIDRVSYSANDDAYVARIIKADGTRENVTIKTAGVIKGIAASTAKDLYNETYGTVDLGGDITVDETLTTDAQIKTAAGTDTLKEAANRIVSYKINSKGELNTVEFITGTLASGVEYKESTMKIGNYRISDATAIVDATSVGAANIMDATAYTASDLASGSVDMFVDGETYTVVLADKGQDNCYKFALVLAGNASIGLETGFAIVDSVDSAIDEADGEVKTTITVLDAAGKGELVTYFVSEDATGDVIGTPDRGTVVALGLKDGVVVAYEQLFTSFANVSDLTFTNGNTIFSSTLAAGKTMAGAPGDAFWKKANLAKWDDSTNGAGNGWARVGFGMILNKNGSSITFGNVVDSTANDYFDENGTDLTFVTDIDEVDLAADVNVYVVDNNYANKTGAGRIAVGSVGSIMKSTGAKEVPTYTRSGAGTNVDPYVYTATGSEVWSVTNVPAGEANYAYFKVVDGDITDIVVFVPAN